MPKKLSLLGLVIVVNCLFTLGALVTHAPDNIVNTFWSIDIALIVIEKFVGAK